MMEKYKQSFMKLVKNKKFIITIILVAIASYGYLLCHGTVNEDTLSADRYFEGNELIAQGRLMAPLLEKIFHIMNFYPFLADFIAVILLIIAAMLYCTLFDIISKGKLKSIVYIIFSCFFISYPLLMEVFIFIPMGISIGLGFCLTVISLMLFYEFLTNKKLRLAVISTVLLLSAILLYESFAIVYLLGVLMILFIKMLFANEKKAKVRTVIYEGALYIIPLCIAVIADDVIPLIILKIMNIPHSLNSDKGSMYHSLGIAGGLKNFLHTVMIDYVINALGYLPITFLIISSIISIIMGITLSIRRKEASIIWVIIGMNITLILLSLIQGKASLYRTCQGFEVFVAFIFMIISQFVLTMETKKLYKNIFTFAMFFMIFYQVKEIYKLEFMNDIRYQKEKSDMIILGHELESKHDVENKPVVFYGDYEIHKWIDEITKVKPNSLQYNLLKAYCEHFDKDYLEKIEHYHTTQLWNTSYVQWGIYAFYHDGSTNTELLKFFRYLGYDFKEGNLEILNGVGKLIEDGEIDIPKWPKEDSIVENDEFIFVYL